MRTEAERVFDQIARSWYGQRHWPLLRRELEEMAGRWQKGRLLNVGCGHGPDFLPFKEKFDLYGLDLSQQMIMMAHKYAAKFHFEPNLLVGDACCLPFGNDSFDWAISVAAYHHVRGAEDRKQALAELGRVLKPGGEAFLTVWNRWQPRFWFKPKEILVPYRTDGRKFQRYYYLFSAGEFRRLLADSGFEVLRLTSEKAYHLPIKTFSRNICALVRKT